MVLDVGLEQKLRIQKIALYFPLFEDGSFLLMEVRRKNIFFNVLFCILYDWNVFMSVKGWPFDVQK